MIHVRVTRNTEENLNGIHLSVTEESIPTFALLINRALNCWDNAPAEIKELGDMLTHGYVTQSHDYKPINTAQQTDYYSHLEQQKIKEYIAIYGMDAWLRRIRENTTHLVLDGTAKD